VGASTFVWGNKIWTRLARFYAFTVTIQQYTAVANSYGEEVKTWANVAGLVDLDCTIGPVRGREVKRPDGIVAVSPWRVALTSQETSIVPKMRAVASNGLTYDILAVEHDSHAHQTSLDCEVVT
jgi:head-tail adaptor